MIARSLFLIAWLGLACCGAAAQAADSPGAAFPASHSPPIIDPARELKGRELVDALRKGGFVLYMRHAQAGSALPPCAASVLTPSGEEQARLVGSALRELKIPVGAVFASQTCRAQDTARALGLGEALVTEDLNPAGLPRGFDALAARGRRLAQMPPEGTNTVLVSHMHGAPRREEWIHIALCEIAVYRPDGKGGVEAVARIPAEAWQELIRSAVAGQAEMRQ